MMLYEYCTVEKFKEFVTSSETVVSKGDLLVEKVLKIGHIFYFLQWDETEFVGSFEKFLRSIKDAIKTEFLNKREEEEQLFIRY